MNYQEIILLLISLSDDKSLAHLIFILALLFNNAGSLYEGMELRGINQLDSNQTRYIQDKQCYYLQ